MTKALKTLIKLNKNKLDKILKDIKAQETERDNVIERKNILCREIDSEVEKYSLTEFSYMLEKYIEQSTKQINRMDAQIDRFDRILVLLKKDLQDQYSELKKFEIALDNRKLQDFNKDKALEAKQIDEANISKFYYRKK